MNEKKPLLTAIPEEVGIPSSAVHRFINRLENKQICMHSFMLIRNGKIAAEGYWSPFNKERKHRMYSISKSFVSVAIGFMEDEGLLSLEDKVISFFPDKLPEEGVHPYIEKMKIRDLLRMATAHEKTTYKQMDIDDWVKTFFIVPPSHLPGHIFSYDTSATFTLTAIVERLSGMSILDYLRPRLLDPIGFSEDAYYIKSPLGTSQGGSGLICTSRDLAKFALTCVQAGKYEGRQLIPARYIKAATSRQIDTRVSTASIEDQQGYGYQFWLTRNNGFACLGMGGQMAVCLPEKDFILITTADTQSNPNSQNIMFDALWDEIYPFISDDPLPLNTDEYNQLCDKISSLNIQSVEGAKASSSAQKFSGNTYKLSENDMGILNVRFDFNGEEGLFEYENKEGRHKLSFGLGKHIMQKFPVNNYECISSAAWVDENSLVLYTYIIDDYFATLKINVTFDEDTVTILMRKSAELFLNEYSGFASGIKIS